MVSKKELRKEVLARRDALSEQERQTKSAQIAKRVIEQEEFKEADKVLLFASYKSEVDTAEIFDAVQALSKDVYYPKVIGEEMEFYLVKSEDELTEGYRGICEPEANPNKQLKLNAEEKVFILMPGAVFDECGNRIGYGGGYYDQYLQQMETKISKENLCKTAIAFECQIVESGVIKTEEHDIKPDYIITEDRVI